MTRTGMSAAAASLLLGLSACGDGGSAVETRDRAHTDALVAALQQKSIRVSAS